MEATMKRRSHSGAFKRQIAEEFITGALRCRGPTRLEQ
jgi:hypothetical protein